MVRVRVGDARGALAVTPAATPAVTPAVTLAVTLAAFA